MQRLGLVIIAAARYTALGLLLALYALMRGSQYLENGFPPNAHMRLSATPVRLDSADPQRTRLGALEYQGGWILRSDVPQFGGLSSLHVDGDGFTGLSDTGLLATWRFDGHHPPRDAAVKPLPPGCLVNARSKASRDSESMAIDPEHGQAWVGLEGRSRICRYDAGFTRLAAMNIAPQMAHWPVNGGPESMVRLPDGRFIVLCEDVPEGEPARPVLIFDRDPTDPRVRVTQMYYDAPDDFSPSDMARLPDGRLVVLNRVFTPPRHLFRTIVSLIEPFAVKAGAHIKPKVLARFDPPLITYNFEAL